MPSVLLFGATGFIGAPLAKQLKQAHSDWPLTIYIRNKDVDHYFKNEVGVDKIVHGTFTEVDKIRTLSKEHDIVINAASSFDPTLIEPILAGLAQRPADSKGKFIHLSGAGNFIDYGTTGKFNPDSKVWNDDNEDDIKLVNPNMLNGAGDTLILKAGEEGKVETHIVCLSVTYGPPVRIGPSSTIGIGYWLLSSNAKQLGYIPYVGDGSAVVSTIHVNDAIPFILNITDRAAKGSNGGSAYSRYYIAHGDTVAWKDLASELGKVMFKAGAVASPEPKSVPTIDLAGEGEVPKLLGSNMLLRGDRAARLGFKATHPSVLVSIHDDLAGHKL